MRGDAAVMVMRLRCASATAVAGFAHSTRSTPVAGRRAIAYARSWTSDGRFPPRKAVLACTRTVSEGAPRVRGSLASEVRSLASATRSRSGRRPTAARPATRIRATVPPPSDFATPTTRRSGGPRGRISTTTRSLGTRPFQSVWDVSTRDARASNPPRRFSSVRSG